MSKTITVPPNIMLKNIKVGEETKDVEFAFATYLINNPLASNAFGGNLEELESCQQLIDVLQTAKPGDELELDDEVWVKINQLCNHPAQPYVPQIGLQLLPFLRAIRDAK
jgi:hypothetical protein